jgi:hypothetical protein
MERLVMSNSLAEILLAYAFTIVLFAGLPAIVLLMVFLPGLMRTTGETVGLSEHKGSKNVIFTKKVPLPSVPSRPLTMVNTA